METDIKELSSLIFVIVGLSLLVAGVVYIAKKKKSDETEDSSL
jgi:LPXTG-motif cell wall-anchored protein